MFMYRLQNADAVGMSQRVYVRVLVRVYVRV